MSYRASETDGFFETTYATENVETWKVWSPQKAGSLKTVA